jgi:uncharacterized protein (DUF1015 family)
MKPPKKLTPEECEAARRALLADVEIHAGTIRLKDRLLVTFPELVKHVSSKVPMEKSQRYAAVNSMCAQSFMQNGGTFVSSVDNYFDVIRRLLIAEGRSEAGRRTGALPPKPSARRRGRPKGTTHNNKS